jgi:aldehyde dehydrogenase (NAD+)
MAKSDDFLKRLGIEDVNLGGFGGEWVGSGPDLEVITPIDGSRIATVKQVTEDEYDRIVARAHMAFLSWRRVPAPRRGEVIRQLGLKLREVKHELGQLVTLEMAKILPEGEGEVQEMIDICDFATGLSRQLYGLTMQSERPDHRMYEQWHPLGVVGVISAFNFPVAVWSWNTAIAAVCGDSVLWKPASKTPLTAIACTRIAQQVAEESGVDPAIFSLVIGKGSSVGERLLHDTALWAHDSRVGRQQRDHRDAACQHGHGAPSDPVRRCGHGGTALHVYAPDYRARFGKG